MSSRCQIDISANLINICQLCDQGFSVRFSKDNCKVLNKTNSLILSGTCHSDNCYHWDLETSICNLTKLDEVELWHRCLRHISLSSICNTIGAEAVLGIFILKSDVHNFCNECTTIKHRSRHFTSPLVNVQQIVFLNSYTWILWVWCRLKASVVNDMSLYVLMIFHDILECNSSKIN